MLVLLLVVGCSSGRSVVEPGAALVHVKRAPAAPAPDELRVWVWDDSGGIWDDVRVPSSGSLPTGAGDDELGTILLQPRSIQGVLRIHVRGLAFGVRVVDGNLQIPSLAEGSRSFTVLLDTPEVDDCPFVPSASQGACPGTSLPDAEVPEGPGDSDGSPNDADEAAAYDGGSEALGTGGASGHPNRDAGPSTGGAPGSGGSPGTTSGGRTSGGRTSSGTSSAQGGTGTRPGGATGTGGPAEGGTSASVSTGGRFVDGGIGGSAGQGGGPDAGSSTIPPAIALPGVACTTENNGAVCKNKLPLCYKHCGPDRQGYKSLSCVNNRYSEGRCVFSTSTDYACYALASVAACAATPPTSGTTCSVASCKPCGSKSNTGYYDNAHVAKVGYCVCSEGTWSCGTVGAWPCPDGKGCS